MSADRAMRFTLGAIAEHLGGALSGDPETPIDRVRAIKDAGAHEIGVVMDAKYFARIDALRAEAVVLPSGVPHTRRNVIVVPDARRAFVALLTMFERRDARPRGVHPRAIVDETVTLGSDVSIGPGVVIEEGTAIGDGVTIGANCVIGANVVIGNRSTLHPNVTLYERTVIGERVIVHSGTVIGSDGFGYLELESGRREKIPQLGHVEIGDDVEIGANCGIDRATLEKTVIGRGTKIDNLVQIGHNSHVGEHCCIVGQAGVGGSATIGSYAVLSGQAGVSDHVTIGERVILAAQAGIHSDVQSGAWLGSPAMPYEKALRVFATLRQLPEYRDRVRALEDALAIDSNGKGNGSGCET